MARYDATEVILSIIYYSGGSYTPEDISEIMAVIEAYDPLAANDKASKTGLRIVPINTNEWIIDD